MAFQARVFRILIASPSDVSEERDVAVRVIQEWNDLNAAERQIVLLPLRWETHSAPEYGRRPQEVINVQVVDRCDFLVGIFWTRVGTPTGIKDSGTVEEIDRVAARGKPVMLYFSQVKQDPDKLDLEQLSKLRDFKKKTYPRALVETYDSIIDFRDKLSRQIEVQLRSILAEQPATSPAEEVPPPITDIVLDFAHLESGEDAGKEFSLATRYVQISDFDQIPDYELPLTPGTTVTSIPAAAGTLIFSPLWNNLNIPDEPNKSYYRQMATAAILKSFFRPVRFWMKNRGGVGARDVYVEMDIHSAGGSIILLPSDFLSASDPSKTIGSLLSSGLHPTKPDVVIGKAEEAWSSRIEVKAIQPQRELSPSPNFLIGATDNTEVTIRAAIYADTLPTPSIQELTLKIEVQAIAYSAEKSHLFRK
jgi:hypothetical protein